MDTVGGIKHMDNKRKGIQKEVNALLQRLGIPSSGKAKQGQFKRLTMVLAVVREAKNKKKDGDLVSSLTMDLTEADSITQQILPNGDFLLSVRLKNFKP